MIAPMRLYSELKRRNVFRVGAAYAIAAWLLIQIADTTFPLFGFGDTPARIISASKFSSLSVFVGESRVR